MNGVCIRQLLLHDKFHILKGSQQHTFLISHFLWVEAQAWLRRVPCMAAVRMQAGPRSPLRPDWGGVHRRPGGFQRAVPRGCPAEGSVPGSGSVPWGPLQTAAHSAQPASPTPAEENPRARRMLESVLEATSPPLPLAVG